MHTTLSFRFVIFLFIAGMYLQAPAEAAGCWTRPYSCTPAGDIDPKTPTSYDERYLAYAELAWNAFIALNFPAAGTDTKPLPEPSPTNGLDYQDGKYTTVWETWSEARDLFLPGAAHPAAFGSGHDAPPICLRPTAEGKIEQTETIVLNEYVQANRMGAVVDKEGEYVRYGINFNRQMANYIVDNTLYSQEGQQIFDKDNPFHNKQNVKFVPGTFYGEGSHEGSIFVKSSWKILSARDDASRFYRTEAYIYDEAGGAFNDEPTVGEKCEKKTVGLVGFHIAHLTDSAPQWVWATFEHMDNGPWLDDFSKGTPAGNFSFFDASKCPSVSGSPDCAFNTVPSPPWNPQRPGQTPTELIRFGVPGKMAIAANINFHKLIATFYPRSVWKNYFLADVQFPTVTKVVSSVMGAAQPNPAYPDGVPTPTFLSNSSMETYIPGFRKGQVTSNGNVIPYDDQMQTFPAGASHIDPFSMAFHGMSGGSNRTTSTCVGCHADSSMTTGSSGDFVFSLLRAQKTSQARIASATHMQFPGTVHSPMTQDEQLNVTKYVPLK